MGDMNDRWFENWSIVCTNATINLCTASGTNENFFKRIVSWLGKPGGWLTIYWLFIISSYQYIKYCYKVFICTKGSPDTGRSRVALRYPDAINIRLEKIFRALSINFNNVCRSMNALLGIYNICKRNTTTAIDHLFSISDSKWYI